MKIAIDVADLDYSRLDGTRIYIQNILKYLGKLTPEDKFFLFHKNEYNELLKPADFENYIDKKIGHGFWWTQLKFAGAIKKLNPEICWMPIQQIPFLPFGYSKKTQYVTTIHDLAFKFFPEHFPLIDKIKLNFYTNIAVKKANKIIAISETTKQDIVRLYPKIACDKIKVIHHGFDRENFQQKFNNEDKNDFLQKYGLYDNRYLLYVGAIQPRKGLITLIRAFGKLKKNANKQKTKDANLKLVLVGEVAWKSKETLMEVENSEFKDDIVLTGKVDFTDLAKFYRWAKIFIFPSLYEGFGLPILEAMASGTPVIVADNSSLVEIGGDAVLKFKTENAGDLKDKIAKLLNNYQQQQELISKGQQHIKKFSWRKCAKETLDFLKS